MQGALGKFPFYQQTAIILHTSRNDASQLWHTNNVWMSDELTAALDGLSIAPYDRWLNGVACPNTLSYSPDNPKRFFKRLRTHLGSSLVAAFTQASAL